MSNATTKLKQTTVNTKSNDGMKNAKRWESLLNALLYIRSTADDELQFHQDFLVILGTALLALMILYVHSG